MVTTRQQLFCDNLAHHYSVAGHSHKFWHLARRSAYEAGYIKDNEYTRLLSKPHVIAALSQLGLLVEVNPVTRYYDCRRITHEKSQTEK